MKGATWLPADIDWHPAWLSLEVAAVALLLVFCAATLAAKAALRHQPRGQSVLDALFTLPLVLPPIVTGYALLILLGRRGIIGAWLARTFDVQLLFTPAAAVLASAIVAFPLMYGAAKASFAHLDSHLLDVARSLGAPPLRTFLTIVLPLSRGGLLVGAVLAFARALGEFGATILVAGNIAGQTATLPTAIYTAAESGDLRLAGFYATLLAVMNFVFIVALHCLSRHDQAHIRP
jgi:molybdate transport system permease protein